MPPPLQPSVDQSGDEAASEKSSPSGSPTERPTNEKRSISFALPPLVKELSPDWCTTPVIPEEAGEAAGAPQDSGNTLLLTLLWDGGPD